MSSRWCPSPSPNPSPSTSTPAEWVSLLHLPPPTPTSCMQGISSKEIARWTDNGYKCRGHLVFLWGWRECTPFAPGQVQAATPDRVRSGRAVHCQQFHPQHFCSIPAGSYYSSGRSLSRGFPRRTGQQVQGMHAFPFPVPSQNRSPVGNASRLCQCLCQCLSHDAILSHSFL